MFYWISLRFVFSLTWFPELFLISLQGGGLENILHIVHRNTHRMEINYILPLWIENNLSLSLNINFVSLCTLPFQIFPYNSIYGVKYMYDFFFSSILVVRITGCCCVVNRTVYKKKNSGEKKKKKKSRKSDRSALNAWSAAVFSERLEQYNNNL